MEKKNSNGQARERVLLWIGVTVTIVWAIATLVQVAWPSHVVALQVHLIMMAVASFFFGGAALTARRESKNGDKDA